MTDIFESMKKFVEFQSDNFWQVYKKMFKTNFYAIIILIVGIIFGVTSSDYEKTGVLLIVIYLFAIFGALGMWFSNLLLLREPQSKISYLSFIKENAPGIIAFELGSLIIIFGIAFVSAFLGPLMIFGLMALVLLAIFLLQFSPLELIFNKRQNAAPFIASAKLVKRNFKEMLKYSLVKIVIICGFIMPLFILFIVQQGTVYILSEIIVGDVFTIIAVFLGVVIFVPLMNAWATLYAITDLSFMYEFWNILGQKSEPKADSGKKKIGRYVKG